MLHQAAVMQEITCDRGTRNKEKYTHTNTTDLVFFNQKNRSVWDFELTKEYEFTR